MNQPTIPTVMRMRALADAGLSYRDIVEAVALYEGKRFRPEQVRYRMHQTGFRGQQHGPGIKALQDHHGVSA